MKRFTTKKSLISIGAIVLWLLIWQIVALVLDQSLFLPSPMDVISRLCSLLFKADFWTSILFSIVRVVAGFLLALIASLFFSVLSYNFKVIEILIEPLVKAIRSIPVASIVILVLVWISSRNLSVVISFMIIFPVIYTNTLEGLKNTPKETLEMATIYHIDGIKRIRYIYTPYVMPYFNSAVRTALGLGWKSAIAAEVIGLPNGSIGEKLYNAKVFFSTPDLFAWTVVIVILATSFEHLIIILFDRISRRLER